MSEQKYILLGLFGPLIAIFFISLSIIWSPWFRWENNALSDLGHSGYSEVAPLFNFGLLFSGFCVIIYSITSFRSIARYSSYFLLITGLSLQLVATFNEVYKPLHFQVSVLFFTSLAFTCISFIIEKKSVLAILALSIGLSSWILYGLEIFNMGISIPETISSISIASWIMLSALRSFWNKKL